MSNFPTTWTPTPYKFKEPKKKRSGGGRLLVCAFVGLVVGLLLSVVTDSPIWIPAGIIATFVLWAVGEKDEG